MTCTYLCIVSLARTFGLVHLLLPALGWALPQTQNVYELNVRVNLCTT